MTLIPISPMKPLIIGREGKKEEEVVNQSLDRLQPRVVFE